MHVNALLTTVLLTPLALAAATTPKADVQGYCYCTGHHGAINAVTIKVCKDYGDIVQDGTSDHVKCQSEKLDSGAIKYWLFQCSSDGFNENAIGAKCCDKNAKSDSDCKTDPWS